MKVLRSSYFYVFISVLWLFSCDPSDDEFKDIIETPEKSAFLELEIEESLLSYNSDLWIIITNDEGEVLNDSLIESGGKIAFIEHQNEISDYLGIYFFKVFNDTKHYRAEGILGIERNTSLSFDKNWDSNDPEIGIVDVEITNFPNTYLGINLLAVSNTQGFAHKGSEIIDSDPYDLVVDTMKFKMSIVKENDTLLIGNSFKDNDPRYLRISGVNDGEFYTFDFDEDFIPYEHIVTHEAPESEGFTIEAFVLGYKGQSLFYNSMRWTSWSYRFTQFGYIDGFDANKTVYSVHGYQGYDEVGFVKKGGIVNSSELELPKYSLSITDTTFSNFDYSYTRSLAYRRAEWRTKDISSNMYIYEDLSNRCKQFSELPTDMSTRYDFIDLNNLEFVKSQFIENLGGYDYSLYFGEMYSNYPQENDFSYYKVVLR